MCTNHCLRLFTWVQGMEVTQQVLYLQSRLSAPSCKLYYTFPPSQVLESEVGASGCGASTLTQHSYHYCVECECGHLCAQCTCRGQVNSVALVLSYFDTGFET